MSQNSYPTSLGNTGSLVDFTANLTVLFTKGYYMMDQQWDTAKQLYISREVGGGNGATFRTEEPACAMKAASETDEGDNYNVTEIAPGYYIDTTVRRRTIGLEFTWFFQHHNKYPDQIYRWYQDTGMSLRRAIELDLTHPFTFGTSATYTNRDGRTVTITTGDGLSPWNTAHTVTGSAITYRNRLANNPAISTGAIEAMLTMGNQNIILNTGERAELIYDTIAVGSNQSNYHQAMKTVNSMSPIEAVNSSVYNPMRNRFKVIRLAFLDSLASGAYDSTKESYWMMYASGNLGAYLWVTEQPNVVTPTIENGGVKFESDNQRMKGAATYEPCWVDPRPYLFSSGDGTA